MVPMVLYRGYSLHFFHDGELLPAGWRLDAISIHKLFISGFCMADFWRCKRALSSFLFLVVRPGAPSRVLAPSSDARSP